LVPNRRFEPLICNPASGKNRLTFSSDDVPVTINNTITGSAFGSSSVPTDSKATLVSFSYTDRGYRPIVLCFITIGLNASNEWYYLPVDREVINNSDGVPVIWYCYAQDGGTGFMRVLKISTATRFYYSIIVLDTPIPTLS
jgi:hypothetical protein